ncbi:hypothetical protein TcWFU_010230 [Taenia crassiceps]|uniref:Uncharacterized protein n=1 Tax=Taenia crassiceps TaxID=6207 RepID=A0ABR4QN20_9CEST
MLSRFKPTSIADTYARMRTNEGTTKTISNHSHSQTSSTRLVEEGDPAWQGNIENDGRPSRPKIAHGL